jgi:putative heme-binding domain-containing protein
MRGELDRGSGSFERGRKVFDNNCAKCHKFEGRGSDVGPALDGAGRDIEYLLVNLLDPNRVVGQPYFVRIVELKDGRIEQGLLAAEDEQSITLKGENNALKVIQRKDIEGKVLVAPKSMMPEGLDKNMTVQDFRDLVRYLMLDPFLTNVLVSSQEVLSPWRHLIEPDAKPPKFSPFNIPPKKPQKPQVGVTGRIPLPPAKSVKLSDIALVSTEVDAPETMTTQLVIQGGEPGLVYLNDRLVHESKARTASDQRNTVSIPVELRKGRNHLSVVVYYRGTTAFYARFHDTNRKLRYPERAQ